MTACYQENHLPVKAYVETVMDAFEDVLNKGGVWVVSKKVCPFRMIER